MDNITSATALLRPIPSSDYQTICQLSQEIELLSSSLENTLKKSAQERLNAQLLAKEDALQAKIRALHLPSLPIECTVWLRSCQEPTCVLEISTGIKKLWALPIPEGLSEKELIAYLENDVDAATFLIYSDVNVWGFMAEHWQKTLDNRTRLDVQAKGKALADSWLDLFIQAESKQNKKESELHFENLFVLFEGLVKSRSYFFTEKELAPFLKIMKLPEPTLFVWRSTLIR
jgi:hypothetical protein